ncbi:MAG: hypothetical protein B7Z54_04215, partial [Sphingobacteriales bacterium 12-47-4]
TAALPIELRPFTLLGFSTKQPQKPTAPAAFDILHTTARLDTWQRVQSRVISSKTLLQASQPALPTQGSW